LFKVTKLAFGDFQFIKGGPLKKSHLFSELVFSTGQIFVLATLLTGRLLFIKESQTLIFHVTQSFTEKKKACPTDIPDLLSK
jgi:hypothetical protein